MFFSCTSVMRFIHPQRGEAISTHQTLKHSLIGGLSRPFIRDLPPSILRSKLNTGPSAIMSDSTVFRNWVVGLIGIKLPSSGSAGS